MTYVSGSRDFIQDESRRASSQFGGAANRADRGGRQCQAARTSRAISTSASFPPSSLTIVNNTSIISNRIDGNFQLHRSQQRPRPGHDDLLPLPRHPHGHELHRRELPRQRTGSASYGGYRYSDRLIRTIDGFHSRRLPSSADAGRLRGEQPPELRSGSACGCGRGSRSPSTSSGEVGRANYPLTPVSDKHYHAINGRADYRMRRLTALRRITGRCTT